jgi:nucleolar protein 56
MPRTLVSTWYGVYLVDAGDVVRSTEYPRDLESLRARLRMRRSGNLTPEEETISRESAASEPLVTRDRRFAIVPGVTFHGSVGGKAPAAPAALRSRWRELLLDEAEESLRAAWDPSIHVEEAVRAMGDLDSTLNLLGERLTSWVSRDAPVVDEPDEGSVRSLARRLVDPAGSPEGVLPGADAELAHARRELAGLYLATLTARTEVEEAVTGALPKRAPNLSALLGPLLAAKMLAQAGGLARMARMPASTIQVLGAERAFFEHLRGRAPPPRHGLLFLHADLHSAPRKARGKLARALAGKVSIAARLDLQGSPIRPELADAFRARRDAIRAMGKSKSGVRNRSGSRLPLDGAPLDG